jgi:myo-inositol-1-phosphate synthase
VFIASNPTMASKFAAAGVPLVGDDIRSQVGATIMHQRIVDLLTERGYVINSTYQLNVGGNSDFLNMLDRDRLSSKKLSKLNAVKSHLPGNVAAVATHVGPSDYVRQLDDKKVAYIHVEGTGFTGARLSLELRLQVEDSPNSAAAVLDVIRYAALARLRGQGGAILPASSYYMKSPPVRMEDPIALRQLRDFGATALLEAGATVQCPVVPTE